MSEQNCKNITVLLVQTTLNITEMPEENQNIEIPYQD